MSEKEKRVVEKLRDAIPNMTDFQKGYVLGMVESSASKHSEQEEERDKGESMNEKVIQFIIGAVAMEYSLVAACYMDSEGASGNMSAIKFVAGAVIAAIMYYWSEVDRKRAELDKRIKRNRRMREDAW